MPNENERIEIKCNSTGIPARSGNVPGSSICSVVEIMIDDQVTIKDVGENIVVFNIITEPVLTDGMQVGRALFIDQRWIVVEDCGI